MWFWLSSAFVPWRLRPGSRTQVIRRYYGLDEASGRIAHLHVYYRLATGGTLLKWYRLPLEEMMFANLRYMGNVAIPGAAAELILLVLRKTLEFGEPTEYPFSGGNPARYGRR